MSLLGIPGTIDPCLNCGPVGSDAYSQCHAALAAKVGSPPPCSQKGIQQNKTDIAQAVADPAGTLLSQLLQPLLQALPGIGVKVGVFLFALMLVIVGFWIVSHQS